MGSQSAKALARSMGVKRLYPNGSYRYFRNHIIINWGSSVLPSWWTSFRGVLPICLNHPYSVKQASNKATAFQLFKENNIKHPIFFTNKQDLIHYTEGLDTFPTIYCRTKLSGYSGDGIVLANSVSEIVDAPLYTIRFKATKEWRIHVFKERVIDFAKKSRRNGQEERASGLIRNHASGWIFRRGGVEPMDRLKDEAIKAVKALGLDFGAVDIAEDAEGNVCVYEVNTSPGFTEESTTLANYKLAFEDYLRNLAC